MKGCECYSCQSGNSSRTGRTFGWKFGIGRFLQPVLQTVAPAIYSGPSGEKYIGDTLGNNLRKSQMQATANGQRAGLCQGNIISRKIQALEAVAPLEFRYGA